MNGRDPLPASAGTLCLYLSELATTHKYSTIRRRVSSINMAHKLKHHLTPSKEVEVQALMEGIKREIGTRQKLKKALMLQESSLRYLTKIRSHLPTNGNGFFVNFVKVQNGFLHYNHHF
ncbi:hypothetical protein [Neobacillus cucumis]|uniref:hypothetical protein n=1 Tax=Neobacillus cucumis TaxID=1740721 RepID=UPI002E1B10D7|nr:hypothetical protein [Neobacillus cucumis]